jgi:hypothetical protein
MIAKKGILIRIVVFLLLFLITEIVVAGPEKAFSGNQGQGVGNISPGNQGNAASSSGRAGGISGSGAGNISGGGSVVPGIPSTPATPNIPSPPNLPQSPNIPQSPNVPQDVNQLINQGFLTMPSQEDAKQNQDKEKNPNNKINKHSNSLPDLDKAINTKNTKEVKVIEKKGDELIFKEGGSDSSKPSKLVKPDKQNKADKHDKQDKVAKQDKADKQDKSDKQDKKVKPDKPKIPHTTEPPITVPPATEPPATVPPTTELPITVPPTTEPPTTEPTLLSSESQQSVDEISGDINGSLLDVITEDASVLMQVPLPNLPITLDLIETNIISIPRIDTNNNTKKITINLNSPSKSSCSIFRTPFINTKFNLYQNRPICGKAAFIPISPTLFKPPS